MVRNILALCCILSLLLVSGCTTKQNSSSHPFPSGRLIDLTHDFSSETIYWPTSDPFVSETVFSGITDKGFFYAAYKFCTAEHGGTHIDAPIHFSSGKKTVDQISLEQLVGEAVIIDISEKALANRDYQVNTEDFTAWESANGKIPSNSIVLLYTGYSQYWPDRVKYMGTDKRGPEAVKELHFPGLHPEAAKWLVGNRKISAIGLDTPSIDYGQSQLFESHQILFEQNIPAFENVTNLDKLPSKGALVIALPMKIKEGSGGPLRIIALVPDENK
ncbi:MAG TPA: cyclase family protein [Thermodesulfobacteriota bacterium]|nr:cyclase family protein [Thermodesulfobacteriota bacterium]